MTNLTAPHWEAMRTDETRKIEDQFKNAGFQQADAYRYNSASIRVRVVDPRFKGVNTDDRDKIVEPILDQLPESTQSDIITLLLFSPDEIDHPNMKSRFYLINLEFDDPSPSML